MLDFKQTRLWATSLGDRSATHQEAREILRASYLDFWERTSLLVASIATNFPDLTVHDTTHLASLWERAGQLLGESARLNPLEAYVFGGAILLHDAGHAVKTYVGGLQELEQSDYYKDGLVNEIRRERKKYFLTKDELSAPSSEAKSKALLFAVRKLHAQKAEQLALQKFDDQYLIADERLRTGLGKLIGKIAASHNWGRSSIRVRLSRNQGAPHFLPSEWGFDPQRLAFLLRCADAIQIDQGRAPHFAYALQQPTGVSRLHWVAQQLGQPQIAKGELPSALVFTSLQDFQEPDADAWWIAYDLIQIAQEELQECYLLMKDLGLETFSVNRILGSRSPEELAEYLKTDGWEPIKAEISVADPVKIVEMFGGMQLYGHSLVAPIRELLQNAADAIHVRAKVSSELIYQGSILVRLQDGVSGKELSIFDNGLGMSEAVLCKTLLEFGKSFLSTDDAQNDFPGLVGSNLALIGRYGIGFFSVFMLSQRVSVTSRRFDKGLDDTRLLNFRDGLSMRPLISKVSGDSLEGYSTRVSVQITEDSMASLLRLSSDTPQNQLHITMPQMLSQLCAGLNCEVIFQVNEGEPTVVHREKWQDIDSLAYLKEVTLAEARNDPKFDEYLSIAATLTTTLEDGAGRVLGRACINFGQYHSGLDLIGGLASGRCSMGIMSLSQNFIGAMEFETEGPSRNFGKVIDQKVIADWATDQAQRISTTSLEPVERYISAMNICFFGGDPLRIAQILLNRNFVSIEEIASKLASGSEIFAPVEIDHNGEMKLVILSHRASAFHSISFSKAALNFSAEVIEPWPSGAHHQNTYHIVESQTKSSEHSFLSILKRVLESKGFNMRLSSVEKRVVGSYVGLSSELEKLQSGADVAHEVVILSAHAVP